MTRAKFRGRKTNSPPPGEAWIWHTVTLLKSEAWRGRSVRCARLLEFLELEHLQHGCLENGRLAAPYTQLVEIGISRKDISSVIAEAVKRGLLEVARGGRKGTTFVEMSRYRLTYYWTRKVENGTSFWKEPTDEWMSFREEQ